MGKWVSGGKIKKMHIFRKTSQKLEKRKNSSPLKISLFLSFTGMKLRKETFFAQFFSQCQLCPSGTGIFFNFGRNFSGFCDNPAPFHIPWVPADQTLPCGTIVNADSVNDALSTAC